MTSAEIVSAGKHFPNTNLSDLSIVGTCDVTYLFTEQTWGQIL